MNSKEGQMCFWERSRNNTQNKKQKPKHKNLANRETWTLIHQNANNSRKKNNKNSESYKIEAKVSKFDARKTSTWKSSK